MPEIVYVDQGTDDWYLMRLGVITGSKASRLLTKTKRKTLARDLAAEQLQVSPEIEHSPQVRAIAWGLKYERMAIARYEFEFGMRVERIGFAWKTGLAHKVGCSPDGLVGDDGIVEVKCPDSKTHVGYIKDGPPPDYIAQMQFNLWVMEREWADFVSFDPRIKAPLDIYRKRLDRDKEMHKQFDEGVEDVLSQIHDVTRLIEV
jgi:predicted phage-related endonuclease